jgi:beta-glucosidase
MRGLLNWIDKRYNNSLIYVFENGVSVPNENQMKVSEAVHDNFRIDYYKGYIQNALDAITLDGVNLGAYFGWSLMDNFEWADGYSTRFGMTYVDYKNNQQRYIKDSIIWYSQFTRQSATNSNVNFTFSHGFDTLAKRDVTSIAANSKLAKE